LKDRFGVDGYPTIFFVRNKTAYRFIGPRTHENIKLYIDDQLFRFSENRTVFPPLQTIDRVYLFCAKIIKATDQIITYSLKKIGISDLPFWIKVNLMNIIHFIDCSCYMFLSVSNYMYFGNIPPFE
jgi:hypothetical protein